MYASAEACSSRLDSCKYILLSVYGRFLLAAHDCSAGILFLYYTFCFLL